MSAYLCRNSLVMKILVHLWLIRIHTIEKLERLPEKCLEEYECKETGDLRKLLSGMRQEESMRTTRLSTILVTVG